MTHQQPAAGRRQRRAGQRRAAAPLHPVHRPAGTRIAHGRSCRTVSAVRCRFSEFCLASTTKAAAARLRWGRTAGQVGAAGAAFVHASAGRAVAARLRRSAPPHHAAPRPAPATSCWPRMAELLPSWAGCSRRELKELHREAAMGASATLQASGQREGGLGERWQRQEGQRRPFVALIWSPAWQQAGRRRPALLPVGHGWSAAATPLLCLLRSACSPAGGPHNARQPPRGWPPALPASTACMHGRGHVFCAWNRGLRCPRQHQRACHVGQLAPTCAILAVPDWRLCFSHERCRGALATASWPATAKPLMHAGPLTLPADCPLTMCSQTLPDLDGRGMIAAA